MGLDKDFLSMLEGSVDWQPYTGEDLFGNEGYGAAVPTRAYVGDFEEKLGAEDGNSKQDTQKVLEADLFTDAVGIGVKDKFDVSGMTFYAVSVTTGRDEQGSPLYHEVRMSTALRG